ncbi:MAG: chromosome partitioning protein ParB [Pseudomonadota bacterium]
MNGLIRSIIPAVVCLSLGLGATAAVAKSECKGMSKSACSADKSCSWVKGYVTKSGNKVDPYCRVKANKKKATDKKSEAKKQSKKAEKSMKAEKGKKADKSKKSVKDKEKKKTKTKESKP